MTTDVGSSSIIAPQLTEPGAPLVASSRVVAAGGWRRVVVGFAVGAMAGFLGAAVIPREDAPRGRHRRPGRSRRSDPRSA